MIMLVIMLLLASPVYAVEEITLYYPDAYKLINVTDSYESILKLTIPLFEIGIKANLTLKEEPVVVEEGNQGLIIENKSYELTDIMILSGERPSPGLITFEEPRADDGIQIFYLTEIAPCEATQILPTDNCNGVWDNPGKGAERGKKLGLYKNNK